MKITVVGAGVVGLTCAVELQAAGHDVTVVAARTGEATTSAVAAAIWFPYRAGPPAAVRRWARRSHARLSTLAATAPDAGVELLTCLELDDDPRPWWLDAVPAVARVATDLPGRPTAWRFTAPRAEPARLLPWLTARLAHPVTIARVERLADVPGDVVVHCAGLGARRLAADPAVVGVAGQVVVAAPGAIDRGLAIADDRGDRPLFYAIPRRDEVILGGSAIEVADEVADEAAAGGAAAPPVDDALTARILADAARFGLTHGDVRAVRVGLRPGRAEVRLARDLHDPRIVHCYGHGGAGFTLAWGCAEDVVGLVRTST